MIDIPLTIALSLLLGAVYELYCAWESKHGR